MIVLATGTPTAKTEGARVTVTVPSGEGSVTVALDIHQALAFATILRREASAALAGVNEAASAEIIPFRQRVRA